MRDKGQLLLKVKWMEHLWVLLENGRETNRRNDIIQRRGIRNILEQWCTIGVGPRNASVYERNEAMMFGSKRPPATHAI